MPVSRPHIERTGRLVGKAGRHGRRSPDVQFQSASHTRTLEYKVSPAEGSCQASLTAAHGQARGVRGNPWTRAELPGKGS